MARIFIAYSRADRALVEGLVALVRRALPDAEPWYDADISGGEAWWRRILAEIDSCDLFVYLLSNDSLGAAYCQAEFREALRLRKTCLPVLVRPQPDVARITPDLAAELRRRKGISMAGGFGNPQANARLIAAIRKLLSEVPAGYQWPLSPVPVLEPEIEETSRKKSRRGSRASQVAGFLGVTALVAVLGVLVILGLTDLLSQEAAIPPTAAALLATTEAPAALATPGATRTPAPPTPTATPTEIDVTRLVATIHARATDAQATRDARPTDASTATALAVTPTPELTASLDANLTQAALEAALQRAADFDGGNLDWEPFVSTFPDDPASGETMLVPAGRFMMGSEDGDSDERPVHEQVFGAPFWIDRTEVSRARYAACVAAGACTATPENDYSQRETQPVNRVTWLQAREYCAWRGMRLPTEAEWEYAARGPDGWVYPWGGAWDEDNAVYSGNAGGVTADVGSHPAGASWVGALDLSGNVWEWVSSLYSDYPYDAAHEGNPDTDAASLRVLRGGSFNLDAAYLRAADRIRLAPDYVIDVIGFRCARDASSADR